MELKSNKKRDKHNPTVLSIEKWCRSLFDTISVGIVIVDLSGNIIEVNSALLKMLGSKGEKHTKAINILRFPPLVESGFSNDFLSIINGSKSICQESRAYKSKWNKNCYFKYVLTPLLDKKKIIGVQGVFEDISSKIVQNQELEDSKSLFQDIFNNIPIGMYRTTIDGKFILYNPKFKSIVGIKENSTSTKDKPLKVINNYPRKDFLKLISEYGIVNNYEVCWKNLKGEIIWTSENARLVKGINGEPIYIEGIITDITEKKMMELDIIKVEKQYFEIVNRVPVGIYRATIDGEVMLANSHYLKTFKLTRYANKLKELNLKVVSESACKYDRASFLDALIRYGELRDYEYQVEIGKMNILWLRENVKLIKDARGKALYYEGVMEDITKKKLVEDQLYESYKHLGLINRQVSILSDLNNYRNIKEKRQIFAIILRSANILTKAKISLLFKFESQSETFTLLDYLGQIKHGEKSQIAKVSPRIAHFAKKLLANKLTVKEKISIHDMKYLSLFKNHDLTYYIHIPLSLGYKLIGSLLFTFDTNPNLSSQEIDFLEVFSVQATFLLNNTEF